MEQWGNRAAEAPNHIFFFFLTSQFGGEASELLIALYGESGKHARTATGAAQLPYGASIQLDMVVELRV